MSLSIYLYFDRVFVKKISLRQAPNENFQTQTMKKQTRECTFRMQSKQKHGEFFDTNDEKTENNKKNCGVNFDL